MNGKNQHLETIMSASRVREWLIADEFLKRKNRTNLII
jgi:hypothetical protein